MMIQCSEEGLLLERTGHRVNFEMLERMADFVGEGLVSQHSEPESILRVLVAAGVARNDDQVVMYI